MNDDGRIRYLLERLIAKGHHPYVAAHALSVYAKHFSKAGVRYDEVLDMFEEDFLGVKS